MFRGLGRCASTAALAAVVLIAGVSSGDGQESRSNPFEFLAPAVVVSDAERQRLDRDDILARTLPGKDGQLAVFVATRLMPLEDPFGNADDRQPE